MVKEGSFPYGTLPYFLKCKKKMGMFMLSACASLNVSVYKEQIDLNCTGIPIASIYKSMIFNDLI